jgi:cellulose synthase/poly-beta-1,6-N-acetylglucosamine synthase-like glycosyltransferase
MRIPFPIRELQCSQVRGLLVRVLGSRRCDGRAGVTPVNAVPRVSVIIPSYNSAHFLPACAASLQRQTWQDFEVLIVDDGSTDNIREVVADLRNEPRVRCVHQERRGLPGARNARPGRSRRVPGRR